RLATSLGGHHGVCWTPMTGRKIRRRVRARLAWAGVALLFASTCSAATEPGEPEGGGREEAREEAMASGRPEASVRCELGSFRAGRWPSACWRPYADDSPFNRKVPADPPELDG